jgi:pimeloyl-ACP methyl ester carboxylesterase
MISVDGRNIDFQDSDPGGPGDDTDNDRDNAGPVILFVPGSFSTPAAWRPIMKLLPGHRFVATSLCGYGATDETRSSGDHDMAHEVRVIGAVAAQIGRPVHLVGHSFGGSVAFAAALAGAVDVLSITTFEANPLDLMRVAGRDDQSIETRRMSDTYEAALAAGEVNAPRRIIDFWGGDGAYDSFPDAVQDYCRQTAYANVLDWHTCFGFDAPPQDYAGLDVPALLVRGGLCNPVIVTITDMLAASIPGARTEVVDGAGHFLISSHPQDCAALLTEFLDQKPRQ